MIETYFASPERSDDARIREEISFLGSSTLINGLLHSVSGLLAVLNEHRQILALNESLLEMLGVGDAETMLGLRLGEAIRCVHSHEMPGGCGTSEHCATCGAAIAIVAGLAGGNPVEKTCNVVVGGNSGRHDLFFRVRGIPVSHEGRSLLLLFLQDITYQQKLASLERLFFHDLNGIIHGISCASELIVQKAGPDVLKIAQLLNRLSLRLGAEVAMQQYLIENGGRAYQPSMASIAISQIIADCRDIFAGHPAAYNKNLRFPDTMPDESVVTDSSLVLRVLINMITNALEASEKGGEVRLSVAVRDCQVMFSVWNRQAIPAEFAKRIFQRNFSTKAESGRGLGTFSMKLFGEDILGGKVEFTSSEQEGTLFNFSLPLPR